VATLALVLALAASALDAARGQSGLFGGRRPLRRYLCSTRGNRAFNRAFLALNRAFLCITQNRAFLGPIPRCPRQYLPHINTLGDTLGVPLG